MARYQCRACGFDGHAAWVVELVCPTCGSRTEVRAAIGVEEMTEAELTAAAVAGGVDLAGEGEAWAS